MKVDIWLDFVCPFCYMGDKQFKEALEQFAPLKDIEINYRSFELDPRKHRDKTASTVETFAKKYNMPLEKAKHIMEKTAKKVESIGLRYDYEKAIQANTFDAHRLNYYAKRYDKDGDMTARIMKAHFADGLDIGDRAVLADLASEVGLSREEVTLLLNSDQYSPQIAQDRERAIALNVDVVPTLIFNDHERIAGVLSLEDYIDALNKMNK